MNYIDILKEKYKNLISLTEKCVEDIMRDLKLKWCIEEIDVHKVSPNIFGLMICNIKCEDSSYENDEYDLLDCIRNFEEICEREEYNFSMYKILNCSENKMFYNKYTVPDGEKFIYVVFEHKTGSIYSNCSILSMELTVEKGVSKQDYDNNTNKFIKYIGAVDNLKREERDECGIMLDNENSFTFNCKIHSVRKGCN